MSSTKNKIRMKIISNLYPVFFLAFICTISFSCSGPSNEKKTKDVIDTLALARSYNDSGLKYVRGEKNYQKGIIFFSKAIAVKPNYSVAYTNRGNAYRFLKEFDKSEADIQMAIKLAPSDTLIHLTLARLYIASERYDKAVVELSTVLKMYALDSFTTGGVYAERGNAYKKLNQENLAKKDFSKAFDYGYKIETEK